MTFTLPASSAIYLRNAYCRLCLLFYLQIAWNLRHRVQEILQRSPLYRKQPNDKNTIRNAGLRQRTRKLKKTKQYFLSHRWNASLPPFPPSADAVTRASSQKSLFSFPESTATLPPFGPIEGRKSFFQISSQWESQKKRFAFIFFRKIQFLPTSLHLRSRVHVVPPLFSVHGR
jgi:hypothetical protein